jgi:GNAT superfamily N-acetyltransferase
MIERLTWDSEFFGTGIGRLLAESLTLEVAAQSRQWCRENQVSCLYFLGSDAIEPPSGFHLIDQRLTLAWEAEPVAEPAPAVRPFETADLAVLEGIARQSHRDSRFYSDPFFDPARCDDFYATWIRRSCEGWAELVLVATVEGVPAGYVTCHNETIGLIAVAAGAQRRGLGRQLVIAAQQYFHLRGAARISVVTQGRHHAARALYENRGFRLNATQHWYHYHA